MKSHVRLYVYAVLFLLVGVVLGWVVGDKLFLHKSSTARLTASEVSAMKPFAKTSIPSTTVVSFDVVDPSSIPPGLTSKIEKRKSKSQGYLMYYDNSGTYVYILGAKSTKSSTVQVDSVDETSNGVTTIVVKEEFIPNSAPEESAPSPHIVIHFASYLNSVFVKTTSGTTLSAF